VGEAVITGLVLRFILLTRPDLIYEPDPAEGGSRGAGGLQVVAAGLAAALAVGIFLAPFASEHPDGLEYVGGKLGFLKDDAPATLPVPIPDYAFPGLGRVSLKGATAAAGVVGTLVVFGVGVSLAVVAARTGRRPGARPEGPDGATPDAA
ncbi:MAG: PDGLE domain-containing protein, partial [Planctomycetia bacterium]|nr:PDGLE domain-containing protein [Planctomycetia bacterium]